jgi:hypothetical protein
MQERKKSRERGWNGDGKKRICPDPKKKKNYLIPDRNKSIYLQQICIMKQFDNSGASFL